MTPLGWWHLVLDGLLPRFAVAAVVAVASYGLIWRYLLPRLVWGQYRKEMKQHVLEAPPVDEGAGSADIAYLTMTYDCREQDLLISGQAPPAPYWQMGIYDEYVRAVQGGHLNHRTVAIGADGRFTVRLSRTGGGRPDTLDCSENPRGVFIYRVVLPTGPVPTPTVQVVRPGT
jgi:hypothetical protein